MEDAKYPHLELCLGVRSEWDFYLKNNFIFYFFILKKII
jgi:hypothetical protein